MTEKQMQRLYVLVFIGWGLSLVAFIVTAAVQAV